MTNFDKGRLQMTLDNFNSRFTITEKTSDAFGRQYLICKDENTQLQCIYKEYFIESEMQKEAVFENIQNFKRLSHMKCVCKLLGYCLKNNKELLSAFQYNDITLRYFVQINPHQQPREEVYLFLIEQLILIVKQLKILGIEPDDINQDNILVSNLKDPFLKIFYDEKDKDYNYLFERSQLQLYWSTQKLQTQVFQAEDYITDGEESIFQIGLMMLDIIYSWEISQPKLSSNDSFQTDQPIRKKHNAKNFYLITDKNFKLNHKIITQTMADILNHNKNPILKEIISCISSMIAPISQRAHIDELISFIRMTKDRFKMQKHFKIHHQKDKTKSIEDPHSLNLIGSQKDSLKYSESQKNVDYHKITQKKIKTQNILRNDHSNQNIIPTPILQQIQKINQNQMIQKNIRNQLINIMEDIQKNQKTVHKKYFNGSIYFGEVNGDNQREGKGIYSHQHQDLYFGIWKLNQLCQGVYIFKNGETFQGTIANGKQGKGRYRYSNSNIYEGDWKDDLKDGNGKMIYGNGDIYSGNWRAGKKHGFGKYFYSSGVVFQVFIFFYVIL